MLFHVLNSSAWYSTAHVLPFSQRRHEKTAEGRAALGSQKTVKVASFERAISVSCRPFLSMTRHHRARTSMPSASNACSVA